MAAILDVYCPTAQFCCGFISDCETDNLWCEKGSVSTRRDAQSMSGSGSHTNGVSYGWIATGWVLFSLVWHNSFASFGETCTVVCWQRSLAADREIAFQHGLSLKLVLVLAPPFLLQVQPPVLLAPLP